MLKFSGKAVPDTKLLGDVGAADVAGVNVGSDSDVGIGGDAQR